MNKQYIKPQTREEQVVLDAICQLTISSTPADSTLEVLTPERYDDQEWEEM